MVATPEGDLYSASLDGTIRRWRDEECVEVLEGHEGPVLCLLRLPNGDLVSGSGDCSLRVWSGGKCTHTIAAHSDSVRCGEGPGVLVGSACRWCARGFGSVPLCSAFHFIPGVVLGSAFHAAALLGLSLLRLRGMPCAGRWRCCRG